MLVKVNPVKLEPTTRPVLPYGSQTWPTIKTTGSHFLAAEMKVLRVIRGIILLDGIRNEKRRS